MKIAIIQISEAGNDIAKTLIRELSAKTIERKEVGKLWQKYDAFRGQSEFATWVTRILLNVCYDMVRDRARERSVLADYGDSDAMSGDDAEEARLLDRLDEAIAQLPQLYRESLSIGVLSGRSPEEAAAMLGCSRNTLYQRIHKAKQLLAKSIREVSYEEA